VYEPNGNHISYSNTVSSLGGRLMRDMQNSPNSIEIISYNFNEPSSIFNGTFSCIVRFAGCSSSCGIPIRFNLTILQGLNNDWHHYSGVLETTSTDIPVATFIVPTSTSSTTCSSIRTLNESMFIARRNKNSFSELIK
jgi:hypothetical protein